MTLNFKVKNFFSYNLFIVEISFPRQNNEFLVFLLCFAFVSCLFIPHNVDKLIMLI